MANNAVDPFRDQLPLRQAFDFLNERLAMIFETVGQKYFPDPWAARNAYIQVILDRSSRSLALIAACSAVR